MGFKPRRPTKEIWVRKESAHKDLSYGNKSRDRRAFCTREHLGFSGGFGGLIRMSLKLMVARVFQGWCLSKPR